MDNIFCWSCISPYFRRMSYHCTCGHPRLRTVWSREYFGRHCHEFSKKFLPRKMCSVKCKSYTARGGWFFFYLDRTAPVDGATPQSCKHSDGRDAILWCRFFGIATREINMWTYFLSQAIQLSCIELNWVDLSWVDACKPMRPPVQGTGKWKATFAQRPVMGSCKS